MHICFKIIKFLLHSTLLYMFRTLLRPSSGAFHHYTFSLWLPCGVMLVASSSPVLLTTEQGCLHVLDTTASIIRSLPPLHIQPLVTVWCCVGCVLQHCSVDTAVTTEQGWRTQPTQRHTVTRGCMCSGGRLLMMGTVVSETCRAT
jgi:hypothetical protein